jgi:hypothetical protein
MHGRRIAALMVAGIACAGVVGFSISRPSLPKVRFPDGSSSQILKVSFGTNHVFSPESLWKKTLRRVLPDAVERVLGPGKVYQRTTPYNSLAIYMGPLRSSGGNRWLSMDVETIFPDGTVSRERWNPSSYYPIVFANYARGEKEILVRLGGVEMKVPNPRQAKKAFWVPRALPQTNNAGGNQVVLKRWRFLRGVQNGELQLEGRSTTPGPVGWMQWRTTLFDPWGNWTRGEWERRPACPGAREERAFRLIAEGTEYISGGFVEAPVDHQYQLLRPSARMTNWGIKFLAFLGPGAYEITKEFEIKGSKRTLGPTNAVSVIGSSWVIKCTDLLTLAISDKPIREVRVRERLSDKSGRVFAGARMGSAIQSGMVAQIFRPRVPTVITNLEVEVLVRWPPAEFVLNKPEV